MYVGTVAVTENYNGHFFDNVAYDSSFLGNDFYSYKNNFGKCGYSTKIVDIKIEQQHNVTS